MKVLSAVKFLKIISLGTVHLLKFCERL